MYTLTSYCKVDALLINLLYTCTGHISVHIHISYVLGYVLRGGAGGGIGLDRIVPVCNILYNWSSRSAGWGIGVLSTLF